MKTLFPYILIFMFALPLSAQQRPTAQLRRQLQREMAMARYLVETYPDAEAEDWLHRAEKLQREAKDFVQRKRIGLANQKAKDARAFALQVIQKLGRVHLSELAQEVRDLIERALVIVPGSKNLEAERLLKQAQLKLRQAKVEGQKRQWRKALELLRTARFQAERSLLLVQEDSGGIDAKLVAEQRRFENLMQKAEMLLPDCKDEQAQELYQQVMEKQSLIDNAIARDNQNLALELYYNSTRLLLRAIDLCQGDDTSVQFQAEQELTFLEESLLTFANDDKSAPGRKKMFEKARVMRDKARAAMGAGDFARAQQLASNGIAILQGGKQDRGSGRAEGRLRLEIDRLQADINAVKNSNKMDDPAKQALIMAAEECAKEASISLQNQDEQLALQTILAGNRMLLRVESKTRGSSAEATAKLGDLINKINEARTEPKNVTLLVQADRAAARAQAALDQGYADVALEYIRLGQDIMNLHKP